MDFQNPESMRMRDAGRDNPRQQPDNFGAQVLAPSVGVGASRGPAPDVGAKCWCWRISAGPRLMLAPSVGVGASRGTAADVGAKCWCWRITRDRG